VKPPLNKCEIGRDQSGLYSSGLNVSKKIQKAWNREILRTCTRNDWLGERTVLEKRGHFRDYEKAIGFTDINWISSAGRTEELSGLLASVVCPCLVKHVKVVESTPYC